MRLRVCAYFRLCRCVRGSARMRALPRTQLHTNTPGKACASCWKSVCGKACACARASVRACACASCFLTRSLGQALPLGLHFERGRAAVTLHLQLALAGVGLAVRAADGRERVDARALARVDDVPEGRWGEGRNGQAASEGHWGTGVASKCRRGVFCLCQGRNARGVRDVNDRWPIARVGWKAGAPVSSAGGAATCGLVSRSQSAKQDQ